MTEDFVDYDYELEVGSTNLVDRLGDWSNGSAAACLAGGKHGQQSAVKEWSPCCTLLEVA